MQANILTQFLLPLTLAMIMFGMGLGLTTADFKRLFQTPKIIAIGLLGQLLLLPVLAFMVCIAFNLSTPLAIGLMILSACPGGTTSNVVCQLAKANLALSVTLTAITTVICVVSTPLLIKFSIGYFAQGPTPDFSLTGTTLGLIVLTLIPVLLGLAFRHRWQTLALRLEPKFRRFSLIFLMVMVVAVLIKERTMLAESFGQVFGAAITLNLLAIAGGMLLGFLSRTSWRNSVTMGIEVGIQNGTMAILIAITFLQVPSYSISAGVYSITMYLGVAMLVAGFKLIGGNPLVQEK